MFQVTFYLRSGIHFTVPFGTFSTRIADADGKLVGLDWTTVVGKFPHLHHIEVNEIAAIVIKSSDDHQPPKLAAPKPDASDIT